MWDAVLCYILGKQIRCASIAVIVKLSVSFAVRFFFLPEAFCEVTTMHNTQVADVRLHQVTLRLQFSVCS